MPPPNEFMLRPPTLDRWSVTAHRLQRLPEEVWEVSLEARCLRRRRPLFHHTETVMEAEGDYRVTDLVHHWSLVLDQDRPTTHDAFIRGLTPAGYDEPTLF